MTPLKHLSLVILLAMLGACDKSSRSSNQAIVLAEVGNRALYYTDADGIVPQGTSVADSLRILQEFVNGWVRDAALLEEAEDAVGTDEDLERLVEDYRNSLLIKRYGDQLIENSIDTAVSNEELEKLYQSAGEAMLLSNTLIRATLIKVPVPVPEKAEFDAAWYSAPGSSTNEYLKSYVDRYAVYSNLNSENWVSADELGMLLPGGRLSSTLQGTRVAKDDNYVYYVRIFEEKGAGSYAPLAYVRDRLRKVILEERSATFLGSTKEKTYAAARQRNAVKIYIGNE